MQVAAGLVMLYGVFQQQYITAADLVLFVMVQSWKSCTLTLARDSDTIFRQQ